uniref:Uncharacterized protein n=1 Tax=Meloidogyne enterolobii TaxID=390850 RepID=A0A6V7V2U3_MELEN|nr:unnamed protein product [Meloidogyne enterolobii]
MVVYRSPLSPSIRSLHSANSNVKLTRENIFKKIKITYGREGIDERMLSII